LKIRPIRVVVARSLCENMMSSTEKYIMYCMSSEKDRTTAMGNMHRKCGAVRTCGFKDMRTDRQTLMQIGLYRQTYRHDDHAILRTVPRGDEAMKCSEVD